MDSFVRAFGHTVGLEGGYVHDPRDRGGATKFGITEKVARENGYTGEMKDLPLELAQSLYRRFYWAPLELDAIAQWDEPAAIRMFDIGVNIGVGAVARFFQRALNVLNRNGSLYAPVIVDGVIRPATLACLAKLKEDIDKRVLRKMVECEQGMRYIELVEKKPDQAAFIRGWYDKRVAS